MSTELKPYLCKFCGERRDSPSPLIVCLGCAGSIEEVRRGEDGVCRCPDCEERVCGLPFDVAQKAVASVMGAKQAADLVKNDLLAIKEMCLTGG